MLEDRDKKSEKTCARGAASVTVGGQCIVALPDIAHELSVATEPATRVHVRLSAVRPVIRGRRTLA